MCLTDSPISKPSVMGRGDSCNTELSEKKKGKVKICGHLVHENPHRTLSSKTVEELTSLEFTQVELGSTYGRFCFQSVYSLIVQWENAVFSPCSIGHAAFLKVLAILAPIHHST